MDYNNPFKPFQNQMIDWNVEKVIYFHFSICSESISHMDCVHLADDDCHSIQNMTADSFRCPSTHCEHIDLDILQYIWSVINQTLFIYTHTVH